MTHTPGPWHIEEREDHAFTPRFIVVAESYDDRIAVMSKNGAPRGDSQQALENAYLIAAAPNLLEACEAIAGKVMHDYEGDIFYVGLNRDEVNKLFADIAKAKGGEP